MGGLYADATAGGGVGAGAGLAGTAGSEEVYGTSYAGSSAGGVYKEKTRVKAVSPVSHVSHGKLNFFYKKLLGCIFFTHIINLCSLKYLQSYHLINEEIYSAT